MKKYIFPAIKLTALSLLLLSCVYTLIVLGIAKVMPSGGQGKQIVQNGESYYANIGQSFTEDRYFWGRPSAVDYNAAGSGGSNKGPINPEYLQTVQVRIDTFVAHNPDIEKSQIPVDLVTASGSGLDPDISTEAAMVQVKRVSKTRNIPADRLRRLIENNTEKPFLGLFGPERINVLKLNLALDRL